MHGCNVEVAQPGPGQARWCRGSEPPAPLRAKPRAPAADPGAVVPLTAWEQGRFPVKLPRASWCLKGGLPPRPPH